MIIRVLTTAGPLPVCRRWAGGAVLPFANGRFIPGQAAISMAVPSNRRGAYMSLVGCSRDLACGLTAALGSQIVVKGVDGRLLNFDRLGLLAIGASLVSLLIFRRLNPWSPKRKVIQATTDFRTFTCRFDSISCQVCQVPLHSGPLHPWHSSFKNTAALPSARSTGSATSPRG